MKLKLHLLKLLKCGGSPLNFLFLYRFASKWEHFLLFVGCVFTLVKASIFPFIAITYAEITGLLVERTYRIGSSTPAGYLEWFGGGKTLKNATAEENDTEIINDSTAYLYVTIAISVIQLVAEFISLSCFNYAANSQVKRLRIKYFTALMRQEIGWYDLEESKSNFTLRLDDEIDKIKAGIGEQASHFLNTALTTMLCFLIAFIFGWQLTLIVIIYLPIVFALKYTIAKFRVVFSIKELNAFNQAANFVDEVLSGVRTVFAFGGENIEIERYKKHLVPIQKVVEAKANCACIEDAAISFLYFFCSASAFWFGANWVLDDRDKANKTYTTSALITVFINLTVAVESMVKLPPLMDIFTSAHASAKNIFAVIDQKSKLDPMRGSGKIVDTMKINGNIEFKDVSFSYPTRPQAQILNGLNLKIRAGQTVALFGNSENGKSCLHLLQRFYDPNRGNISIDDYDIRSLNINSLRSCIACVNQEPVLFSATIAENIRYGRPNATDREIMAASRSSGAHEFIMLLPQSYNTVVGEGGPQFSSGQKQQIAIARALVQDPKVLLLDESTAALNHHSEKYIQDALDRVSKGRTTIVVSHRMSAIKNADRIVFIHQGQIVEDGTHSELIALNGHYYEMVKSTQCEMERDNATQIDSNVYQTPDERLGHPQSFKFIKQKFPGESKIEEGEVEPEDTVAFWESIKRIPSLVESDWIIVTIAICSSIALGFTTAIFSVIFAEIYGILSIRSKDEAIEKLSTCCLACVAIGVLAFIATVLQTSFFAKIGAKLAQRLRLMTFAAILRQECGWFDRKESSVEILSSHLSGDAANVQNAIGFPISIILQSTTSIVLSIIIAFSISLKLSIVCAIPVIMIIAIVLMEARTLSKSVLAEKDAIACAMKVASEAITNIRTVASLRQEKGVILRFSEESGKVQKVAEKSIVLRSLLSSMNQMISTSAYGFALCYGGVMVAHHEIYYKDVIRISELLLYGLMTMGQTLVFAPTVATAFIAVYRLFKIIDRNPRIGSSGITKKSQAIDQRDDVSFKGVGF